MTYLLDTNVLSETRKRIRDKGVTEWISNTPTERVHLSVLTVGEIGSGITQVRERGDHAQAALFESWLDDVVETYGDRIVPVTVEIALEWGEQSGRQPISAIDGLIAATAAVHRWTVVTSNVKVFQRAGARVLNPFTQ